MNKNEQLKRFEQDFKEIHWHDVSIMEQPNKKIIIVLLVSSLESASKLYDSYLKVYNHDLHITKNKQNEYCFELDFIDLGFSLKYQSTLTNQNYPPTRFLGKYDLLISTGIADDKTQQIVYVQPPLKIGLLGRNYN